MEELLASVQGLKICTLHIQGMRRPEVADRLITAKDDIDQPWEPILLSQRAFCAIFSVLHRVGTAASPVRAWAYHHYRATPLMTATICGNWDVAAILVAAGARVDLQNSRNKTALDFAREMSAPDYLLAALEGQAGACEELVGKLQSGLLAHECPDITLNFDDGSHFPRTFSV